MDLFDPGVPLVGDLISVPAARFAVTELSMETITSSFGVDLASSTESATTLPLPVSLSGTRVRIKDSLGVERDAPLIFVSPKQVNYVIPAETASGVATVTVTNTSGAASTGAAIIKRSSPALFSANADGRGAAAAFALRVGPDGSQTYEPIAQFDSAQQKFISRPIDLGPEGERVYLVLFGTGVRHRNSHSPVIASLGGKYAEVSFAGAQGEFAGLDQINVLVPRSLVGGGKMDVLVMVEAQMANPVRVHIK
jgi:uncharacterized protein (TIGR03437 family)